MYFGNKDKPFDFNTYNADVLGKYGFDKPLTQQALDFRALTKPVVNHELGDVPFGGLGIQTRRSRENKSFQEAVGEGGKATLLEPNWLTNRMVNPKDVKYHPDYGYYTNTGNVDWRDDGGFLGAAMPIIKFASLAAGAYGLTNLAAGLANSGLSGIGSSASNVGGYMPNVADAVWSSNATIPSWLSTAGQVANPLLNATKTIGSIANLGGNAEKTGGNMSTLDNITNMKLGDLASTAAPFLSAWQTYNQRNQLGDVYNKAMDLIQTPSPDQAVYRGQLKNLLTNPASFYESPIYQNMFEQGRQALERSQSARGVMDSGNAALELQKYGMQQAANQYMPQAQLLASLSDVGGDQAARALAASTMIEGQGAKGNLTSQALSELAQGLGVQSPREKLLRDLFGKGSVSGKTVGDVVNTVKDWVSPLYSLGDYGSYVNDPSIPYLGEWGPLMNDIGYSDWSSGTFSPDDWGYGTGTSWSDWFE